MRLNQNQIRKLVRLIVEELENGKIIQAKDEEKVFQIIESIIVKDLKIEEEIEKEAEMLIKKYTSQVHSEELDFDLLVKRAKLELAKKKGIKL